MKVKVIGYYGHHNIGDEQYKTTFVKLFSNYAEEIDFIDCDRLHDYTFNQTDLIVLGGGDILNEYFLDKIINTFTQCQNKIIAISVGLPYPSILLDTDKLNIIDYIFVRTEQDLDLFCEFFGQDRVAFLPDISYFLREHYTFHEEMHSSDYQNIISTIKAQQKKIIAITLNRHIYEESSYDKILHSFKLFVTSLIERGYYIVLLPFCTGSDNENDIIIHTDLVNLINERSHILNINMELSACETFHLYNYFYMTIPMRYHACLFSIYNNVPMLPIYTTRKVHNLLLDIEWADSVKLPTDARDKPTSIDLTILSRTFDQVVKNHQTLKNRLKTVNSRIESNLITFNISKVLDYESINRVNRQDTVIQNLLRELHKIVPSDFDFRKVSDANLQRVIVNVVSYYLTKTPNSKYNYGLAEKMFNLNYDYILEWKWILKDNYLKTPKLKSNEYGLFNINYIDQIDYSGVHRAGWQYVYDNIKYLHNRDSDLYLDLYVDRTFHWNKEINELTGIIPYRKNWIGFVHHTFDTTFSEYNCERLLENKFFLESLQYCKGLFVLSNYLRYQFIQRLAALEIFIPVYSIIHPTESTPLKFTYNAFRRNPDKKVVHIGGWLRDIHSFYQSDIKVRKSFCLTYTIRKVALKGSSMNNYYPESTFLQRLTSCLSSQKVNDVSQNVSQNVCQNVSQNSQEPTNNWYKHFIESTKRTLESVQIIDRLSNAEYDQLLSENIVFLNLVDASAVNTVIECIMRNTPVIVNRHPAVVEMLGERYPLYRRNDDQRNDGGRDGVRTIKISDWQIWKAYHYLRNLDKSKFRIENFIDRFVQIIE